MLLYLNLDWQIKSIRSRWNFNCNFFAAVMRRLSQMCATTSNRNFNQHATEYKYKSNIFFVFILKNKTKRSFANCSLKMLMFFHVSYNVK